MYYKDLESNAKAKAEHNRRHRSMASDRLKTVAAKKKARKA